MHELAYNKPETLKHLDFLPSGSASNVQLCPKENTLSAMKSQCCRNCAVKSPPEAHRSLQCSLLGRF